MDLAIITVSYNTRQLLADCLESAQAGLEESGLSGELWVVDNASHDGSAAMVRERFPQVRLIAHDENAGFSAGNNLALKAMGFGSEITPRHVLFLNPDTRVVSDALGTMVRFLDAAPSVGAAGPRLVHGDGSFQHSAFSFPGLAQVFFDFFPLHPRLLDSRLNGRYSHRLYERGQPFAVDHPLGAALMVRGEALVQVGGFDERYFMYCEEVDLCRRIKALGWEICCVPEAQVVHLVGQSTRQVPNQMFVALWRSRFLMLESHETAIFRWAAQRLVHLGLWAETRRACAARERGEIDSAELQARLEALREVGAF